MPLSPKTLAIPVGLLLLVSSWPAQAREAAPLPAPVEPNSGSQSQLISKPRVNAPYFEGAIRYAETAVFWFGRVTTGANAVDVRVGYRQGALEVYLSVMDRRLWFDPSPAPGELTAWDSASLYLDTNGDTGSAPDAHSFRFDARLSWWAGREPHHVAYRGNGSGWSAASVPFGTTTGWRGDAPNNNIDDRGWTLAYEIPFSSLGVSEPPAPGTIWGMGLVAHDRDAAGGPPLADQAWPPTLASQQPSTWGQLRFGIPAYNPPPAMPGGTFTVRQGLNGATVADADAGGSSNCGAPAGPDYFPAWGDLNYTGRKWLNIQNVGDIADWPCFSKYYVTFPLPALPAGAAITSAALVLRQFGNAGAGLDPGPQPSLIQVLTVGEDWSESTLTWNNAPLALENVAAAWVDPLGDSPPSAGVPRQWDVSRAVAQAYAACQPLRLALYEADYALHSGKYFRSSDFDDVEQEKRPTLIVTWGYALSKTASPTSAAQGASIAYTIRLAGTGNVLTLTDALPAGVSAPGGFTLEGTKVVPTYNSAQRRLTWSDSPPVGQAVAIRYVVSIVAGDRRALVNAVNLIDAKGTSTATATVLANPQKTFLPLIRRQAASR
jgi:hypothetical protein